MKFTDKPKWKSVTVAAICLLGLMVVAGRSYAAYTSQASQRGVARNNNNDAVCFASNLLQPCASSIAENAYPSRMVYFSEDQKSSKSITLDLDIYNYANGNVNLVNQRDITYDITVTFSDGTGKDAEYGAAVKTDTGEPGTKFTEEQGKPLTYKMTGQRLIGRTANSHQYVLTFPGADLDRLKIKITAAPVSGSLSVTNNQILATVVAPCVGSKTQSFGFDSYFTDTSGKPADYAGFNYEIRISSGQATGTLTWRNDIVEIDPFSLEKMNTNADQIRKEGTKSTLVIDMDQSAGTGDFLIPFYIVDQSKITDHTAWNSKDKAEGDISMDEVIRFHAKEKTTETENP